jgi:hypothetical protein
MRCADKTSTRNSSKRRRVAMPGLVDLHAKIDRMQILSSGKVVEIAERFAR